jgi:GH24 family phage-related lysozyme (muramidase)
VLDRERRPTLDTSQQSAAVGRLGSIKAPELPMSLAAPQAALGSIGEGVSRLGNVLGALAIEQQRARTITQVAQADGTLAEAYGEAQKFHASNPLDTSEWVSETEKRLTAAKESIFKQKNLTPAAREQIALRADSFGRKALIEVSTSAAKTDFGNTRSVLGGKLARNTEDQNEGEFQETLAVAQKYFQPGEIEAAKIHFKRVGEQKKKEAEGEALDAGRESAVALARGHGLQAALDEIDKGAKGAIGNFSAVDQERLRDAARSTAGQAHAEALSSMVDGIVGNVYTNDAKIEAAAQNSAHLTPGDVEKMKEFRRSFETDEAKQKMKVEIETNGTRNYVALQNEIDAYDPRTDPTREKYAELSQKIATSVRPDLRDELRKPLTEKYGGEMPNAKLRPEIERNVSATLNRMFDATAGVIPWKKNAPVLDSKGRQVKDKYGKPQFKVELENAEAHQRAIDARTKVELRMQEWFRANPDKKGDPSAVRKALDDALPEGTRAAALEFMQKKLTTPAASGPLSDTLISTVKELEGFNPNAFGDYKQTSVGYGTRARSHNEQLTEAQAEQRLKEELSQHAARIDSAAQKVGAKLSPGQRDALISFDFNTGQGAELLTSSGGKLDEVKRRMALYTKAGGQQLAGLVTRRQKELSLFDL